MWKVLFSVVLGNHILYINILRGILMKKNNLKKKLLIIVNALNIGGAENMIYELIKFINRDKYCPEILCYGKYQGNHLESKIAETCNIQYVGVTEKINIKSIIKVFSVIKKIKPDIIHAHQGGVTFAIPWCIICRKPLCITVHSKPQKAFSEKNNRMIYMLKNVLNMMLVAVSRENLSLVQKYYKVNDDKSVIVNNGIDIERFYKIPHDKFTFINVARQDDNKNQGAIIRALDKLIRAGKKANLLLVGDGPCHDKLKSQAVKLGISDSVLFTGNVSDPTKYYAQSDVYVQASFREALPLSVLEAMASGIPIVATNVGGLIDVVDGNGILVDVEDDDALFSAMNTIMELSQSEYEIMANRSKQMVKGYSSVRMAEQYEKVYEKLFKRRN